MGNPCSSKPVDAIVLERPKTRLKAKRKPIPKELIYEMAHSKPIYYRDYKKVLTNEKCAEEVMGSSFLQGQLVATIVGFLLSKLDIRKYVVTTNELGFIYAAKSWRVLDVAIFDRKKVKPELGSTKYVKTAPKIVIEVDTKADVKHYGDILGYLTEKTDDLLNAGVEKVIWILTETHKVFVAEQGKPWILAKWTDSIPVVDDVTMQVEQMLNPSIGGSNE
jgi:Uma2 family endonuclease